MSYTLDYDPTQDRIAARFELPTGSYTCWLTRKLWLMLIFKLSSPAELPEQVYSSKSSDKRHDKFEKTDEPDEVDAEELSSQLLVSEISEGNTDLEHLIKGISVLKTDIGLQIIFFTQQDHAKKPMNIRLDIKMNERQRLLKRFIHCASVAGWDLNAGLKRIQLNKATLDSRAKLLN
jgi:hypothetical protein